MTTANLFLKSNLIELVTLFQRTSPLLSWWGIRRHACRQGAEEETDTLGPSWQQEVDHFTG